MEETKAKKCVSYVCTKSGVERMRVLGIEDSKKTAEITVFETIALENIKKCKPLNKMVVNRELIAKKGEAVTLFEWQGTAFIKNQRGVVFVRNLEDVKSLLGVQLEKRTFYNFFEAKNNAGKNVLGFNFGSRLDKKSDFVLWCDDDKPFGIEFNDDIENSISCNEKTTLEITSSLEASGSLSDSDSGRSGSGEE